jgi:hypothetical protein
METSMQAAATRSMENLVEGQPLVRADEIIGGELGEEIEQLADRILASRAFNEYELGDALFAELVFSAIHRQPLPGKYADVLRLMVYQQAANEILNLRLRQSPEALSACVHLSELVLEAKCSLWSL